jgi:dihydrofolate synthase/folylpolyglutamate synthase
VLQPASEDLAADDYQWAIEQLYSRLNYERLLGGGSQRPSFGLKRMAELLEVLDRPQLASPVVHVAGTKGKGSTSTTLASILQAAGYRTGLYTSPHLLRLEERFQVDGEPCSPAELVDLARRVLAAAERLEQRGGAACTFFELTTAMAWLRFRDCGCQVSVVEVGLGGRLDSTNVCQPELCLITPISFDHQQQLGWTLPEIASQKAGIIKPGVPVIFGRQHPEAAEVLRRQAKRHRSRWREAGVDYRVTTQPRRGSPPAAWLSPQAGSLPATEVRYVGQPIVGQPTVGQPTAGQPVTVGSSPERPSGAVGGDGEVPVGEVPVLAASVAEWSLVTPLLGRHQGDNVGLAVDAARQLAAGGWEVSMQAIERGVLGTRLPGRAQLFPGTPPLLLDTAHNLASMEALVELLGDYFPGEPPVALFAASRDKDYHGMLRLLRPAVDALVLTEFESNPRAVPLEQLREVAAAVPGSATLFDQLGVASAVRLAEELARSRGRLLCVCGSFFLAAEVLTARLDSPN